MRPIIAWIAPLAALAGLAHGAQEAAAVGATVLRVEGELDLAHQALLVRGIAGAKARDDKLVIELDTPGGEVQRAWAIARILDEASKEGVATAAWVNDHALSAGALLALACDDVYMRGTASFGAAQAIQLTPEGIQGVSADEVVEEKYGATWRGSFRAFAEERGRPAAVAEAMVDPDVTVRLVRVAEPPGGPGHAPGGGPGSAPAVETHEERIVGETEWDDLRRRGEAVKLIETISPKGELLNLTADEAVRWKMAEGEADTIDAVLSALGLPGARVTRLEPTRSEELAALLHRFAPMLWVLAFLLAFAELKAPGFGVPGVASALCFAALLFGRYMVGLAEIVHVVLIAVGLILLAVELFLVPGTIWVGLVGGVCMLVGLGWSIADSGGGFAYEMDREIAVDALFRASLWTAVAMVATLALSRFLPRTPIYGRIAVAPADPREARASAMPEAEGAHAAAARPGALGVALTDLRPVGKVALDDAAGLEYEGRSAGPGLGRGARVVVLEARGGRLVVEEAAEDAAGAGDAEA